MNFVSWPEGVNRIILSTSTMSHNKNSVTSDKSENGQEMSRLLGSGAPDEWKVDMIFSNSRNNSFFKKHGITEWEMFVNWFKYKTMMGTIPFYFGKIGDSSDSVQAVYKIKSEGIPSYQFTGIEVKVTMTWQEHLNEYITVNLESPSIDSICAYNGHIEMWYSSQPKNMPDRQEFEFRYRRDGGSWSKQETEDYLFDGNRTCIFYFPPFSTKGVYDIEADVYVEQPSGVKEQKTLHSRFEV